MRLSSEHTTPAFSREVASSPDLIEPLVEEAEAFLLQHIDDEDLIYRAVLLFSEAVTNAMEHGNDYRPERKVRVVLAVDSVAVRIEVRDEGEGFDPEQMADPLAEENLLRTGGRGLFLIRQMADDVRFEDEGRCVHITIHS